MTTFKIIDHDCDLDPVGLKAKTCKVDAPTSAHALAEYLGTTVDAILLDVSSHITEPITATEELWHVVRTWDGSLLREVGAIAL